MTIINDLMSQGVPALPAKTVGQAIIDLQGQTTSTAPTRSVGTGLTAAGTTISDALALTSLVNVVTTAAASTGVKLPDAPIGQMVTVQNNGANAINVFPHSASGTINAGSAGAAVTTASAAGAICIRNSSTDWTVWVTAKEA